MSRLATWARHWTGRRRARTSPANRSAPRPAVAAGNRARWYALGFGVGLLGLGLPAASALPPALTRAAGAVLEVDALGPDGNVLRTATGFFANNRRTIITARSSVEGAARVVVIGPDGRGRDVAVGLDAGPSPRLVWLRFFGADLPEAAVLPLNDTRFPPPGEKAAFLTLNDARYPRPGETVFVLGRPSGLPGMDADPPTPGVWDGLAALRMSAALLASANGSPVVDAEGRLLGAAEIGPERDPTVCRLLAVTPEPANKPPEAPLALGTGEHPHLAVAEPSPPAARSAEGDRVLLFVQAFVQSWNSGQPEPETAFYADRVRYYGREVSRAAVIADTAVYNRRWPRRTFRLVAEPFIEEGDPARARVSVAFTVENGGRRVEGEASYGMEIVPAGDGWRVAAMEEDITRKISKPVSSR